MRQGRATRTVGIILTGTEPSLANAVVKVASGDEDISLTQLGQFEASANIVPAADNGIASDVGSSCAALCPEPTEAVPGPFCFDRARDIPSRRCSSTFVPDFMRDCVELVLHNWKKQNAAQKYYPTE